MAEIIVETVFSVVVEKLSSYLLDKLISYFKKTYRIKKFPKIWMKSLQGYLLQREINFDGFICEILDLDRLPSSIDDDEKKIIEKKMNELLEEVYERNQTYIDPFLDRIKKGLKENDSILNLRILERDLETDFFKKMFFPIEEIENNNVQLLHSEKEVIECIRLSFLDSYLEFFKIDDLVRYLVEKAMVDQGNAENLFNELNNQKVVLEELINQAQKNNVNFDKLMQLLNGILQKINNNSTYDPSQMKKFIDYIFEQRLDPRLDSILAILNNVNEKVKEIQEQQLKDSASIEEINKCTKNICPKNQDKKIQAIFSLFENMGIDLSPDLLNKIPDNTFEQMSDKIREILKSIEKSEGEKPGLGELSDIEQLCIEFFKKYSRWWFNLPRIKYWGSRQDPKFEIFQSYKDLRQILDNLVKRGIIKTKISDKGSKMYKI